MTELLSPALARAILAEAKVEKRLYHRKSEPLSGPVMVTTGHRLPLDVVKALDALEGIRSLHIEKAAKLYLALVARSKEG